MTSINNSIPAGVDLHSHTTASDGDHTPSQLVQLAVQSGLGALAVTDHDTLGGLAEAMHAGEAACLEIVPGIELSATIDRGQCHILGLLIDPAAPCLVVRLQELQQARRDRNDALIARLNALGISITLQDVARFAGRDLVARPHFAQALVEKGVVQGYQEAFDRYLAEGAAASVPKEKLTPRECISLIHEAGGVAVLAHPNNLKRNAVETEEYILRMKNEGLDGIEARYSMHTPEDTERYLKLAQRHEMITSGGSDFHGPSVRPAVHLGQVVQGKAAPPEVLSDLKAWKEKMQ